MTDYVYAARHECGAIVAAIVDSDEIRKDVGREVGRWVREGRVPERITVEQARTETWCQCFRDKQGVLA